jgi:ribose transport system permease protein
MSDNGLVWWVAIVAAVLAGAGAGAVNSGLVAFAGAPSFIATLAIGTAVTGVEYLISDKQTIYTGIPDSFISLGQGEIAGIDTPVIIAVAVLLLGYVLLERSKSGRRMRAIGGNVEAARLAGIRVRRLRSVGFVIVGAAAAGTGLLMSATAASYTPSVAAGLLLPAYAAVFLGATVAGRFSILGTGVGILFLGIIQNGLILLGLADAWINIVQGTILAFAVLLSRLGVARA